MPNRSPLVLRSSLLAALVVAPALAWSQDDPVRRALINQATQARDRGDHTQALALAREAAGRRMSTSLRTFLAQEYAAVGQNEFALSHARTCVQEAEADPNLANGAALLAECRALVARLTPPAPPPPPPSASAEPAPPVAADPPRPEVREPPPPVVRAPPPPVVHEPPIDTPPEAPRSTGPGAGPWVVVGLGVASFGAAGLFYALRDSALTERDAWCGGRSPCELPTSLGVNTAISAQDRADTYNLLTNLAIGVGGAAVAGGLLWFFLGRRATNDRPITVLTVTPYGGGAYLGLRGAL